MKKSIICFILCSICMAAAVYYYQSAHAFLNHITLASQTQNFDNTVLSEIMQERTITAWHESKNQIISAVENQRSCRADIIAIYGSSHYILPYGKNLQCEQRDGCIIGETLAEELFASHETEGQQIAYAGHTWRIYDVVEQPERLFLFEGSGLLNELTFDHINVPVENNIRLTAERFTSQYGISAQLSRLDFYSSLSWLAEMIPTKWSDFDGWKQNWKTKKQELQFVSSAQKNIIESLYLRNIRNCYYFLFAAFLLFCSIIKTSYRRRFFS